MHRFIVETPWRRGRRARGSTLVVILKEET
jgi:hypothetical protein